MVIKYYILKNRKTNRYIGEKNNQLVNNVDDAGRFNVKSVGLILYHLTDAEDFEIISDLT